jgi:hypothetical protein
MHESDGVVLVYNPDSPGQDQQIGVWFDYFVKKNNLKEDQCLVFAHKGNPNNASNERFRPRTFMMIIIYAIPTRAVAFIELQMPFLFLPLILPYSAVLCPLAL